MNTLGLQIPVQMLAWFLYQHWSNQVWVLFYDHSAFFVVFSLFVVPTVIAYACLSRHQYHTLIKVSLVSDIYLKQNSRYCCCCILILIKLGTERMHTRWAAGEANNQWSSRRYYSNNSNIQSPTQVLWLPLCTLTTGSFGTAVVHRTPCIFVSEYKAFSGWAR